MNPLRSTDFELWGGIATVCTWAPARPDAHERAVTRVMLWLADVERAASVYRDDSEICALNRANGAATLIGPVLAAALRVAIEAGERSDGTVDPTVGGLTLGTLANDARVTRRGTYRDITLVDGVAGTVATLPIGVRLDLGSTTKAWAADLAADAAHALDGVGVLVSLMGDIAMRGDAPPDGWVVRVTDDHREGPASLNPLAQSISLTGGGIATSSTTVRRRDDGSGGTVAHVVDPLSWRPVTGPWRTVSVAAGDCVTANIASTSALVRGPEALPWLESLGLPARLIGDDGTLAYAGAWPIPVLEGQTA